MNDKIGIVTVTFNSSIFLNEFFDSLSSQTHKNSIIYFIDNNSDDDTLDKINHFNITEKKVIKNIDNLGIAKGNNQGIIAALQDNCDYILLINDDTSFPKDCFEKLLHGLKNSNADLVAPITYYFDNKNLIWSAGGFFDDIFNCEVAHYGINEKDVGQFSSIRDITYAPTSCLLFKSSLIDDIGAMDERYFIYFDDVDFCYRATIINNKRMICLPDIKFLHKVNGHTKNSGNNFKSDFVTMYSIRNAVIFSLKFFDLRKLFFLIYFFFKSNLKVLFQKEYRRSIKSFYIINRSFIQGFFNSGRIK